MRVFIGLLLVISVQIVFADPAIEVSKKDDLRFKGQGPNPWCFAFAEEQVLKSHLCQNGQCSSSITDWHISIFDIVLSHFEINDQRYNKKNLGNIKNAWMGSSLNFPYLIENNIELRSAKCTLEEDLFLVNRSRVFNYSRANLYHMLINLRHEFLANIFNSDEQLKSYDQVLASSETSESTKVEINKIKDAFLKRREYLKQEKYKSLFKLLSELAINSRDDQDFVGKILGHSKCNDKINKPRVHVSADLILNQNELEKSLTQILSEDKTVYLGVCSEFLRDKPQPNIDCVGHAIAVKAYDEKHYLVIDSAFFSRRMRTRDGGIVTEKSIVHKSAVKYGLLVKKGQDDYHRILEDLKRKYEEETKVEALVDLTDLLEATKKLVGIIRTYLAETSEKDFKEKLIPLIVKIYGPDATISANSEEDRTFIRQTNHEVLNMFMGFEFKTLKDLDQLEKLIFEVNKEQLLLNVKKRNKELEFDFNGISLNANLIWLE